MAPTASPKNRDLKTAQLPRGRGYAAKRVLLGPALPTANLIHERLGRITALAIFSSDALSSVAYATEEMLRTLFTYGAVAAAAFALIMPLSLVIAGVLAILMFSYRQTIKAYPSAGGAYIVTKDNFGLIPAQVAGVALLTDYVLTVAVSVSAGVAAIVAAIPATNPFRVPMALFFISVIAWGNLRGVKESGRLFAAPTYLFISMVIALIVIGFIRMATGSLHQESYSAYQAGWHSLNQAGGYLPLAVVPLFLGMHALASGSAAMTGVEAISNGVPAFRPPEWLNARKTLMWMGATLGTMFLGISFFTHKLQVVPDPSEKSTILADLGHAMFGRGAVWQRRVLRAAGRHHPDPGSCSEHRFRRLPQARELPRRRQLSAASVHEPRPSFGLFERDHRAGSRIGLHGRGLRSGRDQTHTFLCDRCLHLVLPFPGGDGKAPFET